MSCNLKTSAYSFSHFSFSSYHRKLDFTEETSFDTSNKTPSHKVQSNLEPPGPEHEDFSKQEKETMVESDGGNLIEDGEDSSQFSMSPQHSVLLSALCVCVLWHFEPL